MRRLSEVMLMTVLTLTMSLIVAHPIEATPGTLQSASITECNGVQYGKHGKDEHWHEAKKTESGRYTAIGGALSGPCGSPVSVDGGTKTPSEKPKAEPKEEVKAEPEVKETKAPEPQSAPEPKVEEAVEQQSTPEPKKEAVPVPVAKPNESDAETSTESEEKSKAEEKSEAEEKPEAVEDTKKEEKEQEVSLKIKEIIINGESTVITDDVKELKYDRSAKELKIKVIPVDDNAKLEYNDTINPDDDFEVKVSDGNLELIHKFKLIPTSEVGVIATILSIVLSFSLLKWIYKKAKKVLTVEKYDPRVNYEHVEQYISDDSDNSVDVDTSDNDGELE